MVKLINDGYFHCLLAENVLALHDLEGKYLGTSLGQDRQDIYTKENLSNGHYNPLDLINRVRNYG